MPERRAGGGVRAPRSPVLRREWAAAGAAMVDRCGSRLQDVGRPARQADIPRCRRPSFFLSPPSLQSSDHPLHRDRSWINVHYGFVPFLLLFAVGREAAAVSVVRPVIRPHRSTTYVNAAYCDRPSSVVCQSVCLSVCGV